jgi:hypothetical protein
LEKTPDRLFNDGAKTTLSKTSQQKSPENGACAFAAEANDLANVSTEQQL